MIAITGATGFVGSHLLKALAQRDIDFCCLVRSSSPRKYRIERFSTNPRVVDFAKPDSVLAALDGCDTLIHLLGVIQGNQENLQKINIDYTRNIAVAAQRKGIQRILFISSVAAIKRHGFYGQSKYEAEEIIRQSGIPYLILRPAFIYGAGDEHNTNLMIKTLKRYPLIPLLGGGDFKLQPVYVDDVVDIILQALETNRLNSEYTVAGPVQISLKNILRILAAHLKVKRLFLPIPLKPVQFVLRGYIRLFKNTRLPVKQILELDKHEAFDITSTTAAFDFHPRNFEEGTEIMFRNGLCAE